MQPGEATCPRGHDLDEANRRVGPDGRWHCRACGQIAQQRARAKAAGLPLPEYPPLVRGRRHSEQTKAKLSAARWAYVATDVGAEHMQGVWERKRGVPRDEEIRRKISETKTGAPTTAAQQAASDRRKGQPATPAAQAANQARRGRPDTIERSRRAGQAGRGVRKSDQMRQALSKARTGIPLSDEHRAALSAAHRAWWDNATDEQRAARPVPRGPQPRSWSWIERRVADELDRRGEPYEHEPRMLQWLPDFLLPHRNLIIECDGDYWHALPAAVERDARKDTELRSRGYVVVRLSGREINADVTQAVDRALTAAPEPGLPG